MNTASICTIGDEILIGQIVDTNSSHISKALGELGIRADRMLSIGDRREQIISSLEDELRTHDIVITTGGLGPTKDDITKDALAALSHAGGYVKHAEQERIVHEILHSRGLDVLDINLRQALVPDSCEVIPNRLGTAPIMVFRFPRERFGHPATLYSLPGVPFEAIGALPDVIADIRAHYPTDRITHRTLMVYGIAESALAKKIEAWEDALPADMHLAYLPNQLTGIRLRLSVYGGDADEAERRISARFEALKPLLGEMLYAESDTNLQTVLGALLRDSGTTLSAAESCTGGMIAHLITTVPGSSAYFLGSVTSYAVPVKVRVLGVPAGTVERYGVVSSEVAAAMAEGVRSLTGSTYSVSTTGLAGPGGDESNPEGTVWIGVSGPHGTVTRKFNYHNDRIRNIERFAATALDQLRRYIIEDLKQ
ncbi:MAG: CinA family nicotinamide mononucleotide deamidase-related protein [Bacteroidales bacterium]|nr:CinA family nicotinamide mononucleotide deamidase-related protein [Bacteroidales bacterium]